MVFVLNGNYIRCWEIEEGQEVTLPRSIDGKCWRKTTGGRISCRSLSDTLSEESGNMGCTWRIYTVSLEDSQCHTRRPWTWTNEIWVTNLERSPLDEPITKPWVTFETEKPENEREKKRTKGGRPTRTHRVYWEGKGARDTPYYGRGETLDFLISNEYNKVR